MSSQLHPSNPPISGRLKIISLVGTRPHCAICTPAGAITRSGQFSLFSFPRPYFLPSSLPLLHDEQSHPFASFLFPLSPLRLRRDKLRTLKFGAPATTPLYFQPRGLARLYARERERERWRRGRRRRRGRRKDEYTRVARPESWKETCTVITPLTPAWRGKVCSWMAREYTRCFLSGS